MRLLIAAVVCTFAVVLLQIWSTPMLSELEGKAVLVCGASTGIGLILLLRKQDKANKAKICLSKVKI